MLLLQEEEENAESREEPGCSSATSFDCLTRSSKRLEFQQREASSWCNQKNPHCLSNKTEWRLQWWATVEHRVRRGHPLLSIHFCYPILSPGVIPTLNLSLYLSHTLFPIPLCPIIFFSILLTAASSPPVFTSISHQLMLHFLNLYNLFDRSVNYQISATYYPATHIEIRSDQSEVLAILRNCQPITTNITAKLCGKRKSPKFLSHVPLLRFFSCLYYPFIFCFS